MYVSGIDFSHLALTLATISVVLCPTLCGIMAYRVSRTYAENP